MKEINIKSSTLEKGLDLIKEFTGKLMGPVISEIGGIGHDQIKYWRLKNQLRILEKAKEYATRKGINIKQLNLKILLPLLNHAGLEQSEELQNKWSTLLTNMADSQSNYSNNVFPHLLSQISLNEFNNLKLLIDAEEEYLEAIIQDQKNEMLLKDDSFRHKNKVDSIHRRINALKENGINLETDTIELSNMVRLGLIFMTPPNIKTDQSQKYGVGGIMLSSKSVYDFSNEGYHPTPLGKLLIKVCSEKL